MSLPTVEECKTFLDYINRGRAVYDLPAVDTLDFDACEPGNSSACLSATYLAVPAGGWTGSYEFEGMPRAAELAAALGTDVSPWTVDEVEIPDEIRVVTDAFDRIAYEGLDPQPLRDRMVKAGIVAA